MREEHEKRVLQQEKERRHNEASKATDYAKRDEADAIRKRETATKIFLEAWLRYMSDVFRLSE